MPHYEQNWLAHVLEAAGGAEVRAFFGFLRRGPDGRAWRLYLTIDLDDYIEIDESQILHSITFEGPQYPLGGALVWVRRTARLTRVGARSTQGQADFLRGEIMEENFARSARSVGVAGTWKPPVGTGAACTSYTGCAPCLTSGPICAPTPEIGLKDPGPA
jgi:hypothetical protein